MLPETTTGNASNKRLEEFLPVTGARNAKWWYSAFHNVTAIVGAGVLGLPYALSYLSWYGGMVAFVLSWSITLYTFWQMVEMHECKEGKRFDRYHELGQEAFGKRLGLWIVVPQQLIVEVGVGIVYMVTGGRSLFQFYEIVCDSKNCHTVTLTQWIIIFGCIQLVLSQLPNFNSISGISLLAAIMSLGYSVIAIASSLSQGRIQNVSYDLPPGNSTADNIFGVFNALGTVAFAYAGHNVALEIQATIPSTEEKPSKVAMWHGVLLAYAVVAFCYFGVGISGYAIFGNTVSDNILVSVSHPRWLIASANLMVFVHVMGSFQIYTMPVFDMIEFVLFIKWKLPPKFVIRLFVRSLYVALSCFIGCTIPFFGDLLGFFGGFAFAPTTYFLPCIIWLKIMKPKKYSPSWFLNWTFIVIGVALIFVSTIGGFRSILVHASNYKFYQ